MSTTVTQTVLRQRASPSPAAAATRPITIHGRVVARVPTAPPPFTLADIRRAIPSYCFERSLVTSFAYVAYDLAIVASLAYIAIQIPTIFPTATFGPAAPFLQHVLWLAYWVCQGCVMTGLWVLGHECGHGGFADSQTVNDVVGWVIHSALLVPYFSWQISHRKHHGNTGNLQRDEVHVPAKAGTETAATQAHQAAVQVENEDELTIVQAVKSLYRMVRITVMLTLGWPLYLFTNASGNKSYPDTWTLNHFTPSSPIYADIRNGRMLVLLSDLGLLVAIGLLTFLSYTFSFANVLYYYLIPYMITNLFLVLITFLQHTDHILPHYDNDKWDWLRGALATVDRDYGVLNSVMHHIMDTHVVHHLFSNMPHYHAQEATEAVKRLLGPYYAFDDAPIWKEMWYIYGNCMTVKEDPQQQGVYWY